MKEYLIKGSMMTVSRRACIADKYVWDEDLSGSNQYDAMRNYATVERAVGPCYEIIHTTNPKRKPEESMYALRGYAHAVYFREGTYLAHIFEEFPIGSHRLIVAALREQERRIDSVLHEMGFGMYHPESIRPLDPLTKRLPDWLGKKKTALRLLEHLGTL